MSRKKTTLYGEDLERFKELFPCTSNRALAAMFGHGLRWVSYMQRVLGLEKSREYLMEVHSRKGKRLAEYNKRRLSGKKITEIFGEEQGKAIAAKCKAIRVALMERDKRRIRIGLEPLTKLVAADPIDSAERSRRWKMRRIGYKTFRLDHTIYYTDETKRDKAAETRCKNHGLLVAHISRKM